MKPCPQCNAPKPEDALICAACGTVDERVAALRVAGTPLLTVLILGLLALSIYRFWLIGWPAWSGNLRVVALAAMGLGVASLLVGPLWLFGIRSRKVALIVLAVAVPLFLVLNAI